MEASRIGRVFSSMRMRDGRERDGKDSKGLPPHIQTPMAPTAVSVNHNPALSRKLHRSKKSLRSVAPQLPAELWILIFRYATTSTPLSTPSDFPHPASGPVSFLTFPHSHSHLRQRLETYRESMRFKASLREVCKLWSVIALEIVYEFVWVSRAIQAKRLASVLDQFLAFSPVASLMEEEEEEEECKGGFRKAERGPGRFIRRLHIETPVLERCCPSDLRIILDHAPLLQIYSDYRSIRRLPPHSDPRLSPEQLLGALVHPGNSLRRLSWTNYEYDGDDYFGGVSFYNRVVSPMLVSTAAHLEFLELNFCSMNVHGSSSSLNRPYTPTQDFESECHLTLPALKSLKVTLDNATFAVLATWHMPLLSNLSVLSADFSYIHAGFSSFFKIHGPKLAQLELGHSSSSIEEHYLTARGGVGAVPLADWCPNLREFVCSADAQWNWQSPDWISPHVLLPTHPTVELIGIRDMDKRLFDVPSWSPEGEEFFMLEEQIGSLLRSEAFPALRYLRDMSWESDMVRKSGRVYTSEGQYTAVQPAPAALLNRSLMERLRGEKGGRKKAREEEDVRERERGKDVLRFWERVLDRCKDRGVWLEDWRGVNVTCGDLKRASAAPS